MQLNLSEVDLNLAGLKSKGKGRSTSVDSTTAEEVKDDLAIAAAVAEVEEELGKNTLIPDSLGKFLFTAVAVCLTGVIVKVYVLPN
jgi:hypothetical protein